MNLLHLESFYHVAQKKGFSAAADSLDVSKGLISRHVASLEEEFNTQLFHRTTRSVTLTEAGRHLFEKAEQIFLLAQNAHQQVLDISHEARGTICFTSPVTLGERVIKDVLPEYRELCPEVRVQLSFTNNACDIVNGEQDIALRTTSLLPLDAVARPVGMIRNALVVSSDYADRKGIPETPLDIYDHECILQSRNTSWNCWKLSDGERSLDISVSGQVSVNRNSSIRKLCLNGTGIANIPYYLVEEDVRAGRLIQVLPDYRAAMHELHIVYARQRSIPRKLELFKSLLVKWFQSHPEYLLTA